MSREVLMMDGAIAALIAILVLVLTPGVAMAGIIGLLILLACALSFGAGWLRRGHRARVARRMRAVHRRPPRAPRSYR